MEPYINYEINSITELMLACEDMKTGGYEADVDVFPRQEHGFTIIEVTGNFPGPFSGLYGQYWFDADAIVMQVL